MADYHPLITRAIAGLENNTGEARRALYERARAALVAELRGVTPALSESDITRERLALEQAIRKIEVEQLRKGRPERAPSVKPPPEGPAQEAPPASERADADAMPAASPAARAPADRVTPPHSVGEDRPRDRPPLENGLRSARLDQPLPQPAPPIPVFRIKAPAGGVAAEARAPDVPPDLGLVRSREQALKDGMEQVAVRPASPVSERGDTELLTRELDQLAAQFARTSRERQAAHGAAVAPAAEQPQAGRPSDAAEADEVPPRQVVPRSGIILKLAIAVVVLATLGALGAVAYRQRGNLVELYQLFRSPPTQVARESAPARPKIEDRIGSSQSSPTATAARPGQPAPTTQPLPAVAQRVVLYEEDPKDPQGRQFVGSVIWRTETVSPGPGLAPELAVKATIEVPERRFNMSFSMVRNTDSTLPASHTVDIRFNLPPDFPTGGVASVPGVLMKQTEQARGVPLAGLAVKVTNNVFLIGLSAVEGDVQRNTQLLKERPWFDVPIVYNSGTRAILAMEKGTPGERAFNEAFTAWGRAGTASR
jgi:hypothetical protein